ncbi:hypothetical protein HanXRQr2_Chr15g0673291 [Helianthus annuus]|uniref:Uncharacterized protein n=1 Tax=Helianthus annuus TaxID=4232 RepID=A0A251S6E6_HELAN|nr:hypothetical protein HanXRQr2_Chr15g0673291 [Helianthus annuus]
MERAPVLNSMEAKPKTRAGGRRYNCFDPLSIQGALMIVCFHCRAYNLHCLMNSTNSIASKKGTKATSGNPYANGDHIKYEGDENDPRYPFRWLSSCVPLLLVFGFSRISYILCIGVI